VALLALWVAGCGGGTEQELAEMREALVAVEDNTALAEEAQEAAEEAKEAAKEAKQVAEDAQQAVTSPPLSEGDDAADVECVTCCCEFCVGCSDTLGNGSMGAGKPATTLPAGEVVMLASGIALAYEHDGELRTGEYPVTELHVYYTLAEFRADWEDAERYDVQIAWALDPAGTWHLAILDEQVVRAADEVDNVKLSETTLQHWREYVVHTYLDAATEMGLTQAPVVIEQGPPQAIANADTVYLPEGPAVASFLENPPSELPFTQLLLADRTNDEETYVLAIILQPLFELFPPDAPIGADTPCQQHCLYYVKLQGYYPQTCVYCMPRWYYSR
jgi:hypothetical protein